MFVSNNPKQTLDVDVMVFVDPVLFVHASFKPANFKRFLIFPPATSPRPLGPGITSTVTLPPLPLILNGTECGCSHLHSQLPHPSFTGLTLR